MITQRLQRLTPYIPGEQPKDRPYIKLNANENPYPPSPRVAQALEVLAAHNPMNMALYPDPESAELRAAIADMLNQTGGVLCRTAVTHDGVCRPAPENALVSPLTPDMLFAGNGSDEVLSFLFCAFFESDRPLVLPCHTYSFYPVYAAYYQIPLNPVPLHDDMSVDIPALIDAAQRTQSSIILANPNAPTARAVSREQIASLLDSCPRGQIVAVDEAYADFGTESALPLLSRYDNLVVVRTFSKSFSLAGMRLGYAAAQPELISALTKAKNSFNHFPCDIAVQTAGIAACSDVPYYVCTAQQITTEREAFTAFLRTQGWCVSDSQTNFVFVQKKPYKGRFLYEYIKQHGILVRHFAAEEIQNHIRITIGTEQHMRQLRQCLSDMPAAAYGS